MKKFKITITKFFEEEIKASTEGEAVEIAWEMWSQDDGVDMYVEEVLE